MRKILVWGFLAVSLAFSQEVRVAESDAKKAAIEKHAPAYPPMARQMKVTGKVVVDAVVNPEGAVEDVRIVSGNPMLTRGVVEAVKKWKFTPFKAEGKPVRAVANLSFDFQ